MTFIVLAAVTVMFMLMGVLVDVVAVIAATEKEGMTIAALAAELRHFFNTTGRNTNTPVTQFEFRVMLQTSQFQVILQEVGVDVLMLYEMSEIIYEDAEAQAIGLSFERFLEVILSMRGYNHATVKD